MSNTRSTYSPEFKAKIALIALAETMTVSEICTKFEVHSSQVANWKKELQERSKELFEDKRKKDKWQEIQEQELEKLYKQIGKLTVENDWMKKKYDEYLIWK